MSNDFTSRRRLLQSAAASVSVAALAEQVLAGTSSASSTACQREWCDGPESGYRPLLGRLARRRHQGRKRVDPADACPARRQYGSRLRVSSSTGARHLLGSATGRGRHRAFEILGTKGTAVVRPIEPPKLEIDLASAAGPCKAGVQTVPLPAYRRYVDEFEELAAAVRTGSALNVKPDEELLVQDALLRASGM